MQKPTQIELEGMTVNERLFAVGSLDEFDLAMQENDIAAARRVLEKVFVEESHVNLIIEQLYGRLK